MVSDYLKADADRRAALMLGKPIDNFRYLVVSLTDSVKHACSGSEVQRPVVASDEFQCKTQERNAKQTSPRLLKIKPWFARSKSTAALTPVLVHADKGNVTKNKVISSLPKIDTSSNELLSCFKALDIPTVTCERSPSTKNSLKSKSRQLGLGDPVCMKISKTNPMDKKKLKTDKANKHLLKASTNLSLGKHDKPVKRLSKLSTSRSTGKHDKPIKRPSGSSTCPSMSLKNANSDFAASIIALAFPSPTTDDISSAAVASVTNLSSCTIPEADDNSCNSSVEVLDVLCNESVQSPATPRLTVEAANLVPAAVPHVRRSDKARTINSLGAFLEFKKRFPQFASALEKFELYLHSGKGNRKGTGGNIPKNIFAVVSFFVHETHVTADFEWDFVCSSLDMIIQKYLTKHSEMMPIKTMKQHIRKAFRRLSSYLHLLISTKSQYLPSFSKDAFDDIVLNAVQQVPDNYVELKSPSKQKMGDKDDIAVQGEMNSSPPSHEIAEHLSPQPCSDLNESLVKDEVNSMSLNQEIPLGTPIYPFGKPNQSTKNDFFNFQARFPTFVNKLEEYKIYLEKNTGRSPHTINIIVKSILAIVSSYVQETSVSEDFGWKFICSNVHKIIEHYCEKYSKILSTQQLKIRLNTFQNLSSYLKHLQVNEKSNFLPFFSVDVFNDVLKNVMQRFVLPLPKSRIKSLTTQNLPSLQFQLINADLHKIAEVLVSDYVMETLNGVVAHGIVMEPLASPIYLIGMALIPDDQTSLEPSRETACRVQSVLMLVGCLRNGCQSSKLSAITLEDFSKPVWIDSYSALFRPTAYELAHSHTSYVWWTAAELKVLQYYLLHYRHYICSESDPKSPLFPSPSHSTASVGCVLKSREVRGLFKRVLRNVGSCLDVSFLQSHQLRYVYLTEMENSGLTEDQMSDLAWSLGHVEAHPMSSSTISKLRKTVKRSITSVENVFTQRIHSQQNEMQVGASAQKDHLFIPKFNKRFPMLCKRMKLITAQRHVLSKLNLCFPPLPGDKELFLIPSKIFQKKSHRKKEENYTTHLGDSEMRKLSGLDQPSVNKKRKRVRSDDANEKLPRSKRFRSSALQTAQDNMLAFDGSKRQAVIDWLVKMPSSIKEA